MEFSALNTIITFIRCSGLLDDSASHSPQRLQ
jgi:hypothetical protein